MVYQLTATGVEVTSGQAEKLSFSLYDPATREQLARGNVSLLPGEECTWEFITPPEEGTLWQILIYAGERGRTANVGLTIENLTITELD